ncbi:MAG: hypothetical protein SOY61_02980 [Campylobacter sp.]|nr:hypothetical protein [Campylobacter sp.]
MTQGLGISDGILNEIASSFVSLTPRNDGISAMTNSRNDGILDEILNEIASAFSKPRNDGILEFSMMRSSGQARG